MMKPKTLKQREREVEATIRREDMRAQKEQACIQATDSELTLVSAMEWLVEQSEDSHLNEVFFAYAKPYTDFMYRETGLTPVQSVLFSVFVNYSNNSRITMRDLQNWFALNTISMLRYSADVMFLVERRLVCKASSDRFSKAEGDIYKVPQKVIDQVKNNKIETQRSMHNLNTEELFDALEDIFMSCIRYTEYEVLAAELTALYKANKGLLFCKSMLSMSSAIKGEGIVILSYFCYKYVRQGEKEYDRDSLSGLFSTEDERITEMRSILSSRSPLMENDLIEYGNENFFSSSRCVKLTYRAKQLLLKETKVNLADDDDEESFVGTIGADLIPEKDMYYTKEVKKQLDTLSKLIEKDSFTEVCRRLKESNLRTGFCCLFYGSPGTGKTETAMQLARATGRGVICVDFSELRNKWVGESEKRIRMLFAEYKMAVEKSNGMGPILLFNEADGIFTKRNVQAERSVDKMENAIQNIILEEMENLSGIMIATSNLTENMDSAFERRFIYKVRFEQPDIQCRKRIWRSLVSDLQEEEAESLASRFDFTGGQIENISRKYVVDQILFGKEGNKLDKLTEYCSTENINDKNNRKMGFCA